MRDIHYINVDLEIEARVDLSSVVESFGENVVIMYNGKRGNSFLAVLENLEDGGINEQIALFCGLIESLDKKAQKIWDDSFSKVFDIGFQSSVTLENYRVTIEPSVIKRVAAIGATIGITIYPLIQGNDYK